MNTDNFLSDNTESPGKRLQIARQSKGWDRKKVADELHLKPETIAALEQDDFANLPSMVFITGYVRNYASLLGLEPEPLIAGYAAEITRTLRVYPSVKIPGETSGGTRGFSGLLRLMFWVALLAGGVYLSYLLWEQQSPFLPFRTESLLPGGSKALPKTGSTSEEVPGGRQEDPNNAFAGSQGGESPVNLFAPPGVVPLAQQREVPPADEPEAAETAENDPKHPKTSPATPSENPTVTFEFVSSCWVDIRDSKREFKLFGEMKKGETHRIKGTPPYSITLGNAHAVRITVNGKPFPIPPATNGTVARFKIDPPKTETTN